jgi:hypothetical protein
VPVGEEQVGEVGADEAGRAGDKSTHGEYFSEWGKF